MGEEVRDVGASEIIYDLLGKSQTNSQVVQDHAVITSNPQVSRAEDI